MESTRSKLIALLSLREEAYISGQEISDTLHISRSAIWKHMKELEKDGYTIEARRNKGYRIVSAPDKVSENTVQWGLHTEWLGKTIIHKESTTSTQHIAHQLAREGAEHGTVVIADEQTAGKGRLSRTWYSTKNQGVWISIILRPAILPYLAPQLTLLTATVLADVLHKDLQLDPKIKWPNDIILHDKKVAGILTEMQAEQDQINYIIIGIGMNVNQKKEDIPTEIETKATSLYMDSEKNWNITTIIQKLLVTMEASYTEYITSGFSSIKQRWEYYGYRIGEKMKITSQKTEEEAVLVGIAEDGALLADFDGEVRKIYSGEINWFSNNSFN